MDGAIVVQLKKTPGSNYLVTKYKSKARYIEEEEEEEEKCRLTNTYVYIKRQDTKQDELIT